MNFSWQDLVDIGKYIRVNDESNDKIVQQVKSIIEKNGEEKLEEIITEQCLKQFGVVGKLALCDIDRITKPSDVLMATIHVMLLDYCLECGVELQCIGAATDDDEGSKKVEWASKEYWPELLPPGWLRESPRSYSFCYKISKVLDCSDESTITKAKNVEIVIKGVTMGSNVLLVSGVVSSSDGSDTTPISSNISIKDFVARSGEASAVQSAKENEKLGLSEIVTRASALQLASSVKTQLLEPLISPIVPKKKPQSNDNINRNNGISQPPPPRFGDPGGVGIGGGGIRDMRVPPPLGPRGYGDADLYPGGQGGGMLFGPGNPRFDGGGGGFGGGGFPGMGGPPGSLPPGARFDPYGPPCIFPPAPGTGGGPRRPPRGFGPNPDHLRPPGDNNDFM